MTVASDRAGIDPYRSSLKHSGPRPDTEDDQKTVGQRLLVGFFVGLPTLALAAAIPPAWGWALGWHDLIIGLVFYVVTGLGVTVGYHRHFTHASFKAKTGLRVVLAIAGSMSLEGSVLTCRIGLLNHVTWSINSICHTFGVEEFSVRDKSRNVNWLAIPSFGESWHNLHHADPTCARHGALRGQIDVSARIIRWFERLGWAYDVRWPDKARLGTKRTPGATHPLGSMTNRSA